MRFEGDQLRAILAYQIEPVQVRNGFGRIETTYENPKGALSILRRASYYGIGHKKRIRFIQADGVAEQVVPWGAELVSTVPKGACPDRVHSNHTAAGAKQWKAKPERSRSGAAGAIHRIWIRRPTPGTERNDQ